MTSKFSSKPSRTHAALVLFLVPFVAWTCGAEQSGDDDEGDDDGDGAAGDFARGGRGGSVATGGVGASAGTSAGGVGIGGAAGEAETGGGGTSGATGGATTGGSAGMGGTAGSGDCPVCSAIPDCSAEPQVTRLSGRVITPGRDDANIANQVGVPNALVYLLRTSDATDLPAIPQGIPTSGERCDRCENQALGPVLAGAVTDATGAFTIEERVPVGVEVVLVVKTGRFRRATTLTVPADAACRTTLLPATLPDNPTRLPRSMSDGLAVNIPRVAVTTGQNDAIECVLEKMGLAHAEFANPGANGRVHLFRGGIAGGETPPGAGAFIDAETPHADELYGVPATLFGYDIVVADCEGASWDIDFVERNAMGVNVREFVNRGGRMFATHHSFSWLYENGLDPYDPADPIATGLGPAADWNTTTDNSSMGVGVVSIGRPNASADIQTFADWVVREAVTTAPNYDFSIVEPRSQAEALGDASEEFVVRSDGTMRVQLFSFDTPYGAPETAACGRVAYSGFHVYGGGITNPFEEAVFPEHCLGDLAAQEKVLLYALFDLDACVGDMPPPLP